MYFSVNKNLNEITLLGVIISDNLIWQQNTDFICQKARQKLWTLRRIKRMKLDSSNIGMCTQKRSDFIFNWLCQSGTVNSGHQSAQIDRIQKTAVKIILDEDYT